MRTSVINKLAFNCAATSGSLCVRAGPDLTADRAGVGVRRIGCPAAGASWTFKNTRLDRFNQPALGLADQAFAAAQLGPSAKEIVRGTLRSAAPVRATSVRRLASAS